MRIFDYGAGAVAFSLMFGFGLHLPNAPHEPIVGIASYYEHDRLVATGARYDPDGLTAAHRWLPFGTRLCVTDLESGRAVAVVVNDRGPFVPGRILDLSRGAARVLGMLHRGLAPVIAKFIGDHDRCEPAKN